MTDDTTARRSPPGDEVDGLSREELEVFEKTTVINAPDRDGFRIVGFRIPDNGGSLLEPCDSLRKLLAALTRQQAEIADIRAENERLRANHADVVRRKRVAGEHRERFKTELASERAARERAEGELKAHEDAVEAQLLHWQAAVREQAATVAALEQDKQQADEKCARLVEANAWFNGQVDALTRAVEEMCSEATEGRRLLGHIQFAADFCDTICDIAKEALTAAQQGEPTMHIQNATDGGSESNRSGAQQGEGEATWGDSGPIPGQHCGDEFAPSALSSEGHTAVTEGEPTLPCNVWLDGLMLSQGRKLSTLHEALRCRGMKEPATLRPDPVLQEAVEALEPFAKSAAARYGVAVPDERYPDHLGPNVGAFRRARSAHAKLKAEIEGGKDNAG